MKAHINLLVFGATGATGRYIVEQALAQGYNVTAFARAPTKVSIKHPNLKIHIGDVLDYASVKNAMPGQDVVISLIGDGEKRSTLRADGTRQIMKAMENTGIKRFISTSTLGIGDSRPLLSPLYKYLLVPFILKHAFADHEQQEQYIEASQLDWIIVRPSALNNGLQTGSYRHGFTATEKGLKLKISRADVAAFMLKQVAIDTYLHKKVGISN
ncbi:NAD(P)H-binding protein [Mucilaginibacter gynuensis]|uniref:NAD(P)H-binding protein n=1 Tax=Mucilaginibacter gynuensis TaxID=1302236 RepID=A0ABP8G872_9SPHI